MQLLFAAECFLYFLCRTDTERNLGLCLIERFFHSLRNEWPERGLCVGCVDFSCNFRYRDRIEDQTQVNPIAPFYCSGVSAATRPLTAVTHQSMRNQHVQ